VAWETTYSALYGPLSPPLSSSLPLSPPLSPSLSLSLTLSHSLLLSFTLCLCLSFSLTLSLPLSSPSLSLSPLPLFHLLSLMIHSRTQLPPSKGTIASDASILSGRSPRRCVCVPVCVCACACVCVCVCFPSRESYGPVLRSIDFISYLNELASLVATIHNRECDLNRLY
jgi:hypothetical protein